MNTQVPDVTTVRSWCLEDLGIQGGHITCLINHDGQVICGIRAEPSGRAAIARLDLSSGVFTLVHEISDRRAAVTGLALTQSLADARPLLYATWVSESGGGLLRSEDGRRFGIAYDRLGPKRSALWGLAAPVGWAGRLVVAAVGDVVGRDGYAGTILMSEDRMDGRLVAMSEPWSGNSGNGDICDLAVANDRLYVAVRNEHSGFQLWRADDAAGDQTRWTKVIDAGAHRFGHNPAVAGLCAWGRDLYIGTEGPTTLGIGLPVPQAELLRLEPDGQWDVVVGEMRVSPQGLKVPLALLEPGFGADQATLIILAAGASGVLAATRRSLWSSSDGESWEPVWSGGVTEGVVTGILATAEEVFVAFGTSLVGLRTSG